MISRDESELPQPLLGAPPPPRKGSARGGVATLINCAVGAPLLSLPYAFQQTGWAAGLVLTGAIAAMEAFTLYALAHHAEKTGAPTYPALVQNMLGPAASVLLSLTTIAYAFGSCCAYLMILADCALPFLGQAAGGADVWWARREAVIGLLGTGVVLPLCFPQSLDALSGVSALALAGLATIAGAVAARALPLVRAPGYDWRAVHALRFSPSFFQSLPILVFGFQAHTNVIAVFQELEDEPVLLSRPASLASLASSLATAGGGGGAVRDSTTQGNVPPAAAVPAAAAAAAALEDGWEQPPTPRPRRRRRRPRSVKLLGMVRVVSTALGLTAVLYGLLGLCGYLSFPVYVDANILQMYPANDPLMQAARLMLALIQLVSYPVNFLPCRTAVRELLQLAAGGGAPLRGFRTLCTLGFYGATLAVALAVSDLGAVFQLIGGTCGALLIFGYPGALLMSYAWCRHGTTRLDPGQLREPLMGCVAEQGPGGEDASEAETTMQQQEQLQQQQEGQQQQQHEKQEQGLHVFVWWASKLWWTGLALALLTAALCTYTLWSVTGG